MTVAQGSLVFADLNSFGAYWSLFCRSHGIELEFCQIRLSEVLEEDHRDKVSFSYIISRLFTTNVTCHSLFLLTWVTLLEGGFLFHFSSVKTLFPPLHFHTVLICNPHLRRGSYACCMGTEFLYRLFGILLHGGWSLLFSLIIIEIFRYISVDSRIFILYMGLNVLFLFTLLLKLVLCSFDHWEFFHRLSMSLQLTSIVYVCVFFFGYILTFFYCNMLLPSFICFVPKS